MSNRVAWASVVLGAIVTGCAVGPDYHKPDIKMPGAYGTTQPTSQPVVMWWKTFNDPMLDIFIRDAVEGNLDLQIAEQRVREARAERWVSISGEFPQANMTGSFKRTRQPGNAFFVPGAGAEEFPSVTSNLYQAGFDANWEIDIFGHVRRQIEASDAQLDATIENRRDVLVTLLGEVARNYVEYRGFQREIEIVTQNIRAQRETVDLTQAKFKGGLTSELDVAQAQAQVATLEAQIPSLQREAAQRAHHLAVLLGRQPRDLFDVLAVKPIPAAPPVVPVGLPSELLRRRADIRRAERQLAASNALVGVAVAELFPRFSLVGALGYESQKSSNFFSNNSRYWSIGPSVSWPIFSAGRLRAEVAAADARKQAALLVYQNTVLAALEEVENALTAYEKERVRWQALTAAVDSNQRAVNLSRERYNRGLINFLDVLVSERSLYAAQDALVLSETSVSQSVVQLYKALGGGWEEIEAEAEAAKKK